MELELEMESGGFRFPLAAPTAASRTISVLCHAPARLGGRP